MAKKKVPKSTEFSDNGELSDKEDFEKEKDKNKDDSQRGDIDYVVDSVLEKEGDLVGRSAQEWLDKILRSRSSKTVREFIEALEVGLVEVNDFYAVIDELLLEKNSAEVNNLGLVALSAILNPRSFQSLADYKYNNGDKDNQKEVDAVFAKYNNIASLGILRSVVSAQSSSFALIAASQLIESIGKSIEGTQSQNLGNLSQNQTPSASSNGSALSQLQEVLSLLGEISTNHEDDDVRRQADSTIDSLRGLQSQQI